MLNHGVIHERPEEMQRSLKVMEELRGLKRDEFVNASRHYLPSWALTALASR